MARARFAVLVWLLLGGTVAHATPPPRYTSKQKAERAEWERRYIGGGAAYDKEMRRRARAAGREARHEELARQRAEQRGERYFFSDPARLDAAERRGRARAWSMRGGKPEDPHRRDPVDSALHEAWKRLKAQRGPRSNLETSIDAIIDEAIGARTRGQSRSGFSAGTGRARTRAGTEQTSGTWRSKRHRTEGARKDEGRTRQDRSARPSAEPSPYAVLGLPDNAPFEEVKTRRRELMKEIHPDVQTNEADRSKALRRAQEVNAAFQEIEQRRQP